MKRFLQNAFFYHQIGPSVPQPLPHEPCRANRFVVTFPENFNVIGYTITAIDTPSYSFEENRWYDIEVRFVDLIYPSTSQTLFNLLQRENTPFNMWIELLDPVGAVIQQWEINVEKIVKINFGKGLSYSDEGLCEPSIILRPQSCRLNY